MHNRLRNKERESFRRCLIQGYIFLSEREEVARDKTWNYLNVARAGGIVTRRHTQRENSITPVPRVVLMKYSCSRFYGNNKRADSHPLLCRKTFVNVDLEEKRDESSRRKGGKEVRKQV